jgi:AcrR family transcriptional regulator
MARIDPARRAEIGVERRAKSRAQLVEAARALISRRPVDAITVADVTDEAGLSKGAFYGHFDDLDALRSAVANELATELQERIAFYRARTDDPFTKIAIGCLNYIERARCEPEWGALAARGIWAFPSVAQEARLRLTEDLEAAAATSPRVPIKTEVAFDIILGSVLQAMRSASEGRLGKSDAPLLVAGILRALGLSVAEADSVVLAARELLSERLEAAI